MFTVLILDIFFNGIPNLIYLSTLHLRSMQFGMPFDLRTVNFTSTKRESTH